MMRRAGGHVVERHRLGLAPGARRSQSSGDDSDLDGYREFLTYVEPFLSEAKRDEAIGEGPNHYLDELCPNCQSQQPLPADHQNAGWAVHSRRKAFRSDYTGEDKDP
jgi:hypothetical protein